MHFLVKSVVQFIMCWSYVVLCSELTKMLTGKTFDTTTDFHKGKLELYEHLSWWWAKRSHTSEESWRDNVIVNLKKMAGILEIASQH